MEVNKLKVYFFLRTEIMIIFINKTIIFIIIIAQYQLLNIFKALSHEPESNLKGVYYFLVDFHFIVPIYYLIPY